MQIVIYKEITKTRIKKISFTENLENNTVVLVIIGETKETVFFKRNN